MEALWNAVRYKVSADKNRYLKGSFDLDLTYITDRIIGANVLLISSNLTQLQPWLFLLMESKALTGIESMASSFFAQQLIKFEDVSQMLKQNHGDKFMIYNLSERPYDYGKFDNQVRS
jgi:hypothetical protein